MYLILLFGLLNTSVLCTILTFKFLAFSHSCSCFTYIICNGNGEKDNRYDDDDDDDGCKNAKVNLRLCLSFILLNGHNSQNKGDEKKCGSA